MTKHPFIKSDHIIWYRFLRRREKKLASKVRKRTRPTFRNPIERAERLQEWLEGALSKGTFWVARVILGVFLASPFHSTSSFFQELPLEIRKSAVRPDSDSIFGWTCALTFNLGEILRPHSQIVRVSLKLKSLPDLVTFFILANCQMLFENLNMLSNVPVKGYMAIQML